MLPEKIEEQPWQIQTKEELQLLALYLGVRDDWHEPDEQDLTVEIHGTEFDNAGFWGSREVKLQEKDNFYSKGYKPMLEIWVTICKGGKPIAEVNMATLLAFACDTYDGREMVPTGYGARTRWSAVIASALRETGKNAIKEYVAQTTM